jgi:hypothetical protein
MKLKNMSLNNNNNNKKKASPDEPPKSGLISQTRNP